MDNDSPYRFKVGMCLQAGMPFRRAVSLASELGASYGWFDIDFAVEGIGEGGVDAVGELLARNGIEPFLIGNDVFSRLCLADLDADNPMDHPGFRRDLDRLVAAMEGAVRLGAGAVISHGFLWPGNWSVWPMRWLSRGGVIAEVDMKRLVRVYEIALERAERYDVDVVVGNLPWGYTASTENFRLLAERIGSRRLKFMWHPSDNLTCGEWDSATVGFRNVRPWLHSLHVKDLHVRPTDGIHRQDKDTDYRPIGEGDVDYPTILRQMRDTGSDAVLAVYGHFIPEGGTHEDAMRINVANMMRMVAEIEAE